MKCGGCGNEGAYHLTGWMQDGVYAEVCNKCRPSDKGVDVNVPDVFWPGQEHYNPNLCDGMGRPILLRSRRHKAEVMRKLQVQEAGDVHRGTRRL